jgi:hypothetical protein
MHKNTQAIALSRVVALLNRSWPYDYLPRRFQDFMPGVNAGDCA